MLNKIVSGNFRIIPYFFRIVKLAEGRGIEPQAVKLPLVSNQGSRPHEITFYKKMPKGFASLIGVGHNAPSCATVNSVVINWLPLSDLN